MSEPSTLLQRRYRKVTIEEVAARAGVTKSTVSLTLSGRGRPVCSVETAERIRRAAAELHYVPANALRGVNHRATQAIGVSVLPRGIEADGSSFADRLWAGLANEADRAHYTLIHYPEHIRNNIRADPFLDGRIDGLILSVREADTRPQQLAAAGLPAVLINYTGPPPAGTSSVRADEADTVRLILSYLWENGHRRIAHLAGPRGGDLGDRWFEETSLPAPRLPRGGGTAIDRCRGYCLWMQDRGAFDAALLRGAQSWEFTPSAAAALAEWRAMPDPPTAIFCSSDGLALAAIEEARRLHWRVPADLSVVGVDNRTASALAEVPLTTVDVPVEQLGRTALTTLLRLMNGESTDADIRLPVKDLIIRGSSGPAPPGSVT